MSVKSPLRNFGEIKSNRTSVSPSYESTNFSIQLTRIGKMLEESILNFTKRYLIISTELEEMKREFIGQVTLVSEYLNLTKKEIRSEKYESYNQVIYSNISNIPIMPNYEKKMLLRVEKKKENKNFYNRNNLTVSHHTRINSYIGQRNQTISSINSKFNDPKKLKSNSAKFLREDVDVYQNHRNKININKKQSFKHDILHLNSYHMKKNDILDSLSDFQSKAILLLINSNILHYEDKIKLLFTKKKIFNQIKPKDILNDELSIIENKIQVLKHKKDINEEDMKIINKITSYPSKTAKTGLNYLTSEREKELMNNDNDINKTLIKMIYICLGEEFNSNNIKEAYEYLFKKYQVKSVKNLFLEIIYNKVFNNYLNEKNIKNIEKIIKHISENKTLMTNSLMNNINKTFNYVCFSLDEICEFLKKIKGLNKEMKNKIKIEIQLKRLIEEEEKIKKKLKD